MAKASTGYADLDGNHHIAIYRLSTGEMDYEVASLLEASQRLQRQEPIVKRERSDGARLIMSLSKGETVELREGEESGYWVIRGVSSEGRLRKAWEIGSLQQRGSQIEPILSLRTSQGVKTTTLGSHIRPQPLAKALLMAGFQYLDILILCHLHR